VDEVSVAAFASAIGEAGRLEVGYQFPDFRWHESFTWFE
jgi:hypothetical protein